MTYKNRYQKAAYALEFALDKDVSIAEAASTYGIERTQLLYNVRHLRKVRNDLYQLVRNAELSYKIAYERFKAEV